MGTMSHGYHYDMGKKVGYNITVKGSYYFDHVAYKSKSKLISELLSNGHTLDEIEIERNVIDE